MKIIDYISNIKKEDIIELLDTYESLGPLPGIIIPFIESFAPFLPLIVIVMGNAAAYGLWKGFLYSLIGTFLGAVCIFALTRRYGKRFSAYVYKEKPRARALFEWVERKGFTPIFLMSCLPFTPSFLLNVFAGLTKMSPVTFVIAIFLGKGFMVFLISLVGSDIFSILYQPWRLIFVTSLFLFVWLIGRAIEARYRAKYRME